MVENSPVIRARNRSKLKTAVFDLQRFDLLGAVRGKAILQIDAGERCRQLTQIGRGRTDKAGKLTEAPMCRRDGCVGIRQHERQSLGIVARSFDADRLAFDDPGLAAL